MYLAICRPLSAALTRANRTAVLRIDNGKRGANPNDANDEPQKRAAKCHSPAPGGAWRAGLIARRFTRCRPPLMTIHARR
jgi:hypothetical protein